eukprot:2509737-Prymnesium_polylepis.2
MPGQTAATTPRHIAGSSRIRKSARGGAAAGGDCRCSIAAALGQKADATLCSMTALSSIRARLGSIARCRIADATIHTAVHEQPAARSARVASKSSPIEIIRCFCPPVLSSLTR